MSTSRIGVLIPTPLREQLFAPEDVTRLNELGEVIWAESEQHLSVEEAIELLEGCTIGVGSWGTPWPDAQLLEACPHLRLWAHAAGSVKHMFGPHLEGRDLVIASCGPAIAEDVAEITLGQLIIGLKRTLENAAANRSGPSPKPANGRTLAASIVGVIGASHVGRRVIRNLRPFGPRILLYDPFVTEEQARELGVERVADLLELCSESHAVTLHTPALPATEKLLGAPEFQAMRDDAVFVNTARGMCVDEAALIAELEKGRLFAFLDVVFPEPAAVDSPLRRLQNVVYTSHIAGSPDCKIGRQAVDDVAAFLQGKSPLLPVVTEMLERSA